MSLVILVISHHKLTTATHTKVRWIPNIESLHSESFSFGRPLTWPAEKAPCWRACACGPICFDGPNRSGLRLRRHRYLHGVQKWSSAGGSGLFFSVLPTEPGWTRPGASLLPGDTRIDHNWPNECQQGTAEVFSPLNEVSTTSAFGNTHLLTSSSTCNSILSSSTSLRGSLVKILAFLWIGAARAGETVGFRKGGLTLAAVTLGASIIFTFWNPNKIFKKKKKKP